MLALFDGRFGRPSRGTAAIRTEAVEPRGHVIAIPYPLKVGLLAAAYFITGRVGQALSIPPGNVTAVWMPSGIALAAVLLWGNRIWPGIWIGAFSVNVRTVFAPTLDLSFAACLVVASAIATGSTIQTLVGDFLISRLTRSCDFFDRAGGVFLFAAGAVSMCLIGSTTGATSLCLGGFVPWRAFGLTWRTWWLGDTAGVLVMTPLILAWSRNFRVVREPRRLAEAVLFVTLVLAAGQFVFGGWLPTGASAAYLAFPPLMWGAFRFGRRAAVSAVFLMTAMATLSTARGVGPFQGATLQNSLWLLQAFAGVLALSTLALAAVVHERRRMEDSMKGLHETLERRVAERSAVAERRTHELSRSEEATRKHAHTLRLILDNIPDAVIFADQQGKFLLWNPAAELLIGAAPGNIELSEWSSHYGCYLPDQATLSPPEALPLVRALRGEFVRGEEMFLRNRSRPNGVWLRLNAAPLTGEGGTVGGVVVLQDISIIKQEESRLRSIIENVLTGIVMVNEEGRITQVNRQAEVIFGYAHGELCGQELEVLVPEALRRVHRQHTEGYLRDPKPREMAGSLELVGLRKDGQMVALQILLNPIWLEGDRFVLASVLDITENKRAADLIKSVVEFSPDSVIMVDHKGQIVMVNQETERLFGYPRRELIGQSLGVLVPERFRDRHHGQVLGFIGERRQRSMNEGRDLSARRKDGSEFPADISLHSFELNGEGFAVATTRDMTERRRIERESRIAGEIQRAFLPTHAPSILGFDIGGVNCQADSTGGDFYDYLILSRNRIVVFLGDVSGHGFGAAILAAACRSYLRALINSDMNLVNALNVVNRLMYADSLEAFVTATVICIDTATRVVEYINVGHPDGYVLDSKRSIKHRLHSSAPPLGIMEDVDFSVSSTVCQSGDCILMVSDGILEARSSRNVMLGEEGMLAIVRDHPSDDSAMAAQVLCHEATKYSRNQTRIDDMTAVFLRCVGPH